MPSPARSRRFDLIAFDWDGTLYDSTAIIVRSIQEAVRDVGGTVPSDKEAAYVIGMALIPALAHAAPDVPPEKYQELGNRYRFHYLQHQNDLSLFAGVLPSSWYFSGGTSGAACASAGINAMPMTY